MAKDLYSDSSDHYFCVSVGFFSNKRKGRLQRLIGERANFVPPIIWAHCSMNRLSGRLPDYDYQDYQLVFNTHGLNVNLRATKRIVDALKETGFIHRNGTVHEYSKYNKFFSKARFRKAAFAKWRKQRAAEREAQANGGAPSQANGGAPSQKPSQELWLLDKAIELARGAEKKKLLKQRRDLLGKSTGTNLTEQQPQPHSRIGGTVRESEDTKASALLMARTTLKDIPDALSEPMVRTLHEAGDHLPTAVKKKFAKLLEQLGTDRNPVPA